MTIDEDLAYAREQLHEAQRIAALLDQPQTWGEYYGEDCPPNLRPGAGAVARAVIERDLAARRVEAWTHLVNNLRAEAAKRGRFS